MNLEELFYEVLVESIEDVDKIFQKYYESHFPYNRFVLIAKADKYTKVESDGKISKLGKYARLLLTMYANGRLDLEDLSLAKEYVNIISDRNVSVPWNLIKSLSDLYPYVEKYLVKATQTFHEILPYLNEGEDYTKTHDGEKWEIYEPKTEKGACYLGVGAEWCTTWGPLSLNPRNKDKTNRFKQYYTKGPIYIIVNKETPTLRVQFHFEDTEFKDLSNANVDTEKWFSNPELFTFFFPINDETSDEDIKKYYKRRDLLPENYRKIVIDLYKERNNFDGGYEALTIDIDDFDPDIYKKSLIPDENVAYVEMRQRNYKIDFILHKMTDRADDLNSFINTLHSSKSDTAPSEWMGNDFTDDVHRMMEDFWERENELIKNTAGEGVAADFTKFQKQYWDIFNEKFHVKYEEQFDNDNYANIEHVYEDAIEKVEQYVEVKTTYPPTIEFNVDSYNDFVNNSDDISSIDDFNEFLGKFMEYYDIDTQDYEVGSIDWDFPYFSQFESDITEWWNETFTHEMGATRVKLNNIMGKFFKHGKYEDDDKSIKIHEFDVNYEKQTVGITYTDKKKNQTYNGPVLIDNLPKYVSMNMLAESYFKFKKLIK